MKISIIVNGGVKSCCRTFPTSSIRKAVATWFQDQPHVSFRIIDVQEEPWPYDDLALLARKHLGDAMFPLIYADEKLVTVSEFPEYYLLREIVRGKIHFELTADDILSIKAAQRK